MTTGFKEERFPPNISFGATGGLSWLTEVTTVESGFEQRSQILEQPRGRWEVAHLARKPRDYIPLRNFFHGVARGRFYGFRFKDWTDFTVSAGESSVIDALGSPTVKQLAKAYVFGSEVFYRRIQKIVAGTFNPVGGSGLSLDYDSGLLTYSSLPTAFTCEFDCPVRFDTDEMVQDFVDRSEGEPLIDWASIPLVLIRV